MMLLLLCDDGGDRHDSRWIVTLQECELLLQMPKHHALNRNSCC